MVIIQNIESNEKVNADVVDSKREKVNHDRVLYKNIIILKYEVNNKEYSNDIISYF